MAGAALCLAGVANTHALWIEMQPVSYSVSRATGVGAYDYADQGGQQLTDGKLAALPINSSNKAYDWVGWRSDQNRPQWQNIQTSVNIDFTFADTTQIDRIDVDTFQDLKVNGKWNITLPNVYVYQSANGTTWTPAGQLLTPLSTANSAPLLHRELELNDLNINAKYVRVTLQNNFGAPWIMTDEINLWKDPPDIQSVAAVPDSGSALLLLSGSTFLLMALRSRFARRA